MGQPNLHNGIQPKEQWLLPWEKESIIEYWKQNPYEGYRRLCYRMLDENIVAVSPSSVYRVLKKAGLLEKWNLNPSKKGTGFVQPLKIHEHWHIDIVYLNIRGIFYYLCSLLDGCSRFIVHWEIRISMKATEVEIIIQRAKERFPGHSPRIISDNGPQFIAKEFKEFIKLAGMTHVRTSPYYPQSNGKIERWHRSLKHEAIKPNSPDSEKNANQVVEQYIDVYNHQRLHSAIGYITPYDKLQGRDLIIFQEREHKLFLAQKARAQAQLSIHFNSNFVSVANFEKSN